MAPRLLRALLAFILTVASWNLSIILHELGHLVMGLASGYSFHSYRVGSFVLIHADGRW